jgi:hypothetical protein
MAAGLEGYHAEAPNEYIILVRDNIQTLNRRLILALNLFNGWLNGITGDPFGLAETVVEGICAETEAPHYNFEFTGNLQKKCMKEFVNEGRPLGICNSNTMKHC